MHPRWLFSPCAELMNTSRVSQLLHSDLLPPLTQFLWISAQLLIFLFHFQSCFICRLTALDIFFLLSNEILQDEQVSSGLLAPRWSHFFETVKLSLTPHKIVETVVARSRGWHSPAWGSLWKLSDGMPCSAFKFGVVVIYTYWHSVSVGSTSLDTPK